MGPRSCFASEMCYVQRLGLHFHVYRESPLLGGAEHDDGFDMFWLSLLWVSEEFLPQTVLTVPETFHSGKRACRWGLSTRIFDIHRCGMLRDRHCMPIPPKLFPQGVDVRNAWLASSIRVETASLPARFGLEPLKTENFGFRIDSSFMHMLLKFIFKEKSEDNSRSFFTTHPSPWGNISPHSKPVFHREQRRGHEITEA